LKAVKSIPEVSASLSDPALRSPATIEPAAGKPVVAAVAEEKGIILNVKEQGWVEIQTLGASGHVVSNLRLDQASLEAYSNKALAPTQDADAQ